MLIGKIAEITDAKNRSLVGIKGKIIDETKNTITIETEKKEKKIIKNQVTIKINEKVIEGKKITKRIEERLKQ
jgi:ribonuclease P protein subunit POP4